MSIPTLSYSEWLINITPPEYRYKVSKIGKKEYEQCIMTDSEKEKYVDFWRFHNSICKTGCIMGGEHISGWLYWHLNYVKLPIDNKDSMGDRPATSPYFRDNEYIINEYSLEAISQKNVGLMICGTRRFAKSAYIASEYSHGTFLYPNSQNSAVFGNENDMKNVKEYYDMIHDCRPSCFKDIKIIGDILTRTGTFKLCYQLQSNSEVENISTGDVTNLGMGQRSSTKEALAGGTQFKVIYDEVGKYSWLERFKAQKPGLLMDEGYRYPPIFVATGGDIESSEDLEKVMLNAENEGMLVVDFERVRKKTSFFHYVQKSDAKCGLFVPGAMSMIAGKKIEMPFSSYLDKTKKTKKELEELEGFNIHATDWDNAQKNIDEIIANEYKSSETAGNKAKMYYPDQPETSFLFKDNNPYDTEIAKIKKSAILENPDSYKCVEFYRDSSGVVKYRESNKLPYLEFPFKGGYYDAPCLMFEDRAYASPSMFSYVAGWDGYKIDEETSSSSMMTLCIICMIGHVEQIVCSISTRPNNVNNAYEQCKLAIEYYNSFTLCEREDMTGFKNHMRLGVDLTHLLSRQIKLDKTNRSLKYQDLNAPFGQPANVSSSKNHLRSLSLAYCEKDFEEINIDGSHVGHVKGIGVIPDPMLLEEFIRFTPKLNTDRIEAFRHALLLAECIRMEGISPNNYTPSNGYDIKPKKYKRKRVSAVKRKRRT